VLKILSRLMVLALAVVLLAGISLTQSRESGVIQGRIADNEGTELPGVTVIATSPNLMGTRSVVSDQEGKYRFAALPGGTYTIEASLEGFTPTKRIDIILHAGTTLTIDIALSVKALEEELIVTGEAPMVDVTDASTAKTFLTKDVLENIPNFQNVAQIFLLAPGNALRNAASSAALFRRQLGARAASRSKVTMCQRAFGSSESSEAIRCWIAPPVRLHP